MTDAPAVRHRDDVEFTAVPDVAGLRKAVLVSEADGAPNYVLHQYRLDPGGRVPAHTNRHEHEWYVLEGAYRLGVADASADHDDGFEYEVHRLDPGDVAYVPAGTPHWYENVADTEGSHLSVLPTGEDEIVVLE